MSQEKGATSQFIEEEHDSLQVQAYQNDDNDSPIKKQKPAGVLVHESPRQSLIGPVVDRRTSMIDGDTMQRMPSVNAQDSHQQAQNEAPTTPVNIYDTDVGELLKTPVNPRWREFSVERPVKNQDYVTYEVKGYEMRGDFQVRKRYSDFYILRKALRERWPGYYIPAIPPKKAIGNLETDFVKTRMAHLDMFMKQLGQYSFFIDSFEFSCFVKNSGKELEEGYSALLDETPQDIKAKYMQIVPIDPIQMPREQRMNCVVVLQKFQTFVNQAIRNLQGHKSQFEDLHKQRQQMNKSYQSLFQKLTEYEQTGVDFYTDNDKKKSVITHPNHEEYEQVVTQMDQCLGNPYIQIINWIKREIYDLEGLKESIESVKTIEKQIAATKKEIASLKEYVDDLNQNKTSFGTIWRTITLRKMSVDECMQRIFQLETTVDGWEQVLEYVTFYIPMSIFPRFKADRGGQYLQFMADYAEDHSEGASQNIEIWEKIAFFAQSHEEQNNFMLTERIREEIKEEEMGYGGMDYDDDRIHEVQVSVLTDNPYQHETNEQDQFYQTEEDPADVNQQKGDNDAQQQEEAKDTIGKVKSALQKRLEEADDDDDGMFEKPGSDKYSSDGEQDQADK